MLVASRPTFLLNIVLKEISVSKHIQAVHMTNTGPPLLAKEMAS